MIVDPTCDHCTRWRDVGVDRSSGTCSAYVAGRTLRAVCLSAPPGSRQPTYEADGTLTTGPNTSCERGKPREND